MPESPAFSMLVGVAGFMCAIAMYVRADTDAHAYNSDRTCTAGFSFTADAAGLCRLDTARIVDSYISGRKSRRQIVTLALADARRMSVGLERRIRGDLCAGARRGGDTDAMVQYYRARIAQIETRSGLSQTHDMPAVALGYWAFLGIRSGIVGVFSAMSSLARSA